jgi:hypothetical protein
MHRDKELLDISVDILKNTLNMSSDAEIKADLEEDLKPDLNNFLFPRLPQTMSLGDMERLACEIHDLIMKAWA